MVVPAAGRQESAAEATLKALKRAVKIAVWLTRLASSWWCCACCLFFLFALLVLIVIIAIIKFVSGG